MKLLQYIQGLKKGKDAHRLERDAMQDAFLADALEGFESVKGDHIRQIEDLQKRIIGNRSTTQTHLKRAWSIAAGLLLLLSVGSYFILTKNETSGELYSYGNITPIEEDSLVGPPLIIKERNESIKPAKKTPETRVKQTKREQTEKKATVPVVVKIDSAETTIPPDKPIGQSAVMDNKELTVEVPERLKTVVIAEPTIQESLQGRVAGISTSSHDLLSVKGKVTDQNGEPIIGATIAIKGSTQGTVSDVDGNFRLQTKTGDRLQIACIGFETVEMQVNNSSQEMQIALNENAQQLEEVVVVGYGTQKKRDVVGAASRVSTPKEKDPEPIVGKKEYKKYLEGNKVYPTDEECAEEKGTVRLQFYVDRNGRPYNISIKNSVCPSIDTEAIRLLQEGPDWTQSSRQGNINIKF